MILVTGATGLNGRELIARLSARGVPVRALVRTPGKAEMLAFLPGVEIVAGDMARPETLVGALRGIDRAMLISSSDPMMSQVQANFIDAARRAGVRHVVKLSGIMPALDSAFRFARMHAEIERRLEDSGMAYTHLRAGEFMPDCSGAARPASTNSLRGTRPSFAASRRRRQFDVNEVSRDEALSDQVPARERDARSMAPAVASIRGLAGQRARPQGKDLLSLHGGT
jgi:uncharacterized protein YbjT (DUF2867 family)